MAAVVAVAAAEAEVAAAVATISVAVAELFQLLLLPEISALPSEYVLLGWQQLGQGLEDNRTEYLTQLELVHVWGSCG